LEPAVSSVWHVIVVDVAEQSRSNIRSICPGPVALERAVPSMATTDWWLLRM